MTIHIATANAKRARFGLNLVAPKIRIDPANDNGDGLGGEADMRAALLVFAEHGLGAAQVARDAAEAAWEIGEDELFRHWLGICRMLDRRMAARVLAGVARSRV